MGQSGARNLGTLGAERAPRIGRAVRLSAPGRVRLTPPRGFAAREQVCGSVKMPAPQARYSAAVGSLTVGEGAFHLHVAEINAIIRI